MARGGSPALQRGRRGAGSWRGKADHLPFSVCPRTTVLAPDTVLAA